ncbi:hypothetical protein [Bacillus wiedmannii]|uniref:Uncharacterized protein n=1 Tax=Bacillus wiedmannii TaxID=1890302 RepID=A0A2B5X376_9BACI|nr:hypothetical protein [Bacillus wiedmannii]PEM50737.1 hypothetical protein CN611_22550 [Bacillus wiedmannii]PGA94787.1 hypothetical protein COL92_24040 [Bacillus wiedmannii]
MSQVTMAVSKNAFRKIFFSYRDNFKQIIEPTSVNINTPVGKVTLTLSGIVKLENGNFELLNDRIRMSELDIAFEKLILKIDIDFNKICVGGGCLIPNLGDGCAVPNPIPETCIFDNNPDVSLELDLAPFIRSEVSIDGIFEQSREEGTPSKWKVTILPDIPDIDVFDIADTVGDILKKDLIKAIEDLIPGGGEIKKLIMNIIGGASDLLIKVLDAGDDLTEWLKQTLLTKFQLVKMLLEYIEEKFDTNFHQKFLEINDPSEIMKEEEVEWEDGTKVVLPPVFLPIKNFRFEVNSEEMIIVFDVNN